MYNLTNFTTAKTFSDVIIASNQTIGGGLGYMTLIIVFFVAFLSMSQSSSSSKAFSGSGFITLLSCVILYAFSIVSSEVLIGCIILAVLGLAVVIWSE